MHPLLEHASYDEAYEHLRNRSVTGDDIREWYPHWCVGKACYCVRNGRPMEGHHRINGDPYWIPIHWIENA